MWIDETRNSKELKIQCSGIIKVGNAIGKIKLKYITFIIFLEDELERISTARGYSKTNKLMREKVN